jgi:hypothetical protein
MPDSRSPCWIFGQVVLEGRSGVGCQGGGWASRSGRDCLVAASRCLAAVAARPYQIWRWLLGPDAHEVGQVWWVVLVLVLNGSGGGRSSWWVVLLVAGSSLSKAQVAS